MAISSQPFDEEKRNYLRFRSTKVAELSQGGSIQSLKVRLTDFSSAGARLKLRSPHQVKDTFDLIIHPDDQLSRKVVKCQLKWQRGTDLGVKFI